MSRINPFIIFDFETSGLDAKVNAVTEFAAIAIDGNSLREIARYEALIKPYGDYVYTQDAADLTGITKQMCEEKGIELKVFMKEFLAFLKEVNKHAVGKYNKPVFVAHNAQFDQDFLLHIQDVSGKSLESSVDGIVNYHGVFVPKVLDSMDYAKAYWADHKEDFSFSLTLCCARLGVELVGAHSAMPDVEALKEIFTIFLRKLRGQSSDVALVIAAKQERTFKFQY